MRALKLSYKLVEVEPAHLKAGDLIITDDATLEVAALAGKTTDDAGDNCHSLVVYNAQAADWEIHDFWDSSGSVIVLAPNV